MYVEQWRDRHGKVRTYFRRGKGDRVVLPNDLHSEVFAREYGKAMASLPGIVKRAAAVRDTLGGLIASYKASPAYVELRQTTKKGYAFRLDMLGTTHGHRTVSGMTREGITVKILNPYADRPGQRLAVLKMLRVLIRHAIDIGWLKHDPSAGIKRPKTQKIRSWTEAEIATFRAHWPIGTKQRTAFELFLNIGQRRSDVVRMAWPHITGRKIAVTQQKTGVDLVIPLHRDALAALDKAERKPIAILTTAYDRPFTVAGFSQWMRDAISDAGLPLDCQPHGLRKAAGRRLAEAGCTAKEIMAILGHKTLSEAERYTEDAGQAGLAEGAVAKLEGNAAPQTVSPNLSEGHRIA